MVNLTIDGIKVSVPEGSTILQAAREVGVKFLHFVITLTRQ